MTQEKVTVKNRAGLHARPAAIIVKIAQKYECSIYLEKDTVKANAKSIMNIFTLGAGYKTELNIIAEGPDEEKAVQELVEQFENRFEEA